MSAGITNIHKHSLVLAVPPIFNLSYVIHYPKFEVPQKVIYSSQK